jgi:preprotein translocase subunit SecF
VSRLSQLGNNLYRGDISFNIVGNQRRWYAASAVLLIIALGALGFRGLNFGVEFTGGSVFTVPSETCTVETARMAVSDAGVTTEEPIITEVKGSSGRDIRVQTVSLGAERSATVAESLASACDTPLDDVSTTVIGPSWGQSITKKALTGLVVFLAAIVLYLSVAFEWRMAIAALVALAHDVFITVGIYALVGFEVTPASVIGVLTILGYSLYDTVVVFDKVKENTRGLTAGSRMTYSDAANLAVNQTLVRSINTSIVGLLPVAALLFVGAYVLGAGTLKDLALALFVGIAVGTYSSVFIATPVLADLKEREPAMKALNARVTARRASRGVAADPGAADASVAAAAAVATEGSGSTGNAPAQRNQPKRRPSSKRRSGGSGSKR